MKKDSLYLITTLKLMAKLEKALFIVEQLSGGKRLSLKEINDRFERSSLFDGEILPRSFARYKEFILMNWGIIIEYDFSQGWNFHTKLSHFFQSQTDPVMYFPDLG